MKKQSPLLRVWELGKQEHGGLIFAIVCTLTGVALGMLPYYAAAQMIIGLLAGERELSVYLPWLGIALAGYAARTLLYNLALSRSHRATFSILKSIRQRILEKLPRLSLGTVMDMSSGKMKQIIVDQVEGMETTLAHLLPELTANIAGPVLILIYMFALDWRMALLSLVTIPVGMVFMMSIMGTYAKDYEGAVRTTQEMNGTIVEYIGGIEVIKAFNQGRTSYARFTDRVKANAQYYYDWMKRCQFRMSMGYAIVPATLITILPAGWLMYRSRSLPVETFITSVILSLGVAGPLLAAMNFVDTLAQVNTTVETVDGLLQAPEQHHAEDTAEISGNDIVLSHVSFGYHADKNILKDVSLSIPAGSMTALVGPSGSGKSTIAKLIASLWDVKSGSICIGGVDIRELSLEEYNRRVAYVSQDNYLFDDTIRENIRMGRMDATDAEVEEAAKKSGCHEFIMQLENGYDTVAGGAGGHLSGGERQRIAIARAMLKDAPIVILDEATAYTDPENEAVIQSSVAKLVQGKTLIVIAHRLSTIADADCIFVVDDGRIAERGTHRELLENGKLYAKMWKAHIGVKNSEREGVSYA